MTTPIKTQCPQCQASFNLPRAQLNQADAKGRCGRCQHIFLLNEHLVVSANEQPAPIPIDTPTVIDKPLDTKPLKDNQPTHNEKKTIVDKKTSADDKPQHAEPIIETQTESDIDDNLLFHDDMEVNDAPEPIVEYGSLDEMDAWLNQSDPSQSNSANPTNTAPPTKSVDNNHHTDTSADLSTEQSPSKVAATTANSNQPPASAVISSADANNIHNSITANSSTHTSENAWLETLLEEQNDSADNTNSDSSASTNNEPDDTDLSRLLSTIGMATDDQEKINKERNHKIQARMQQQQTPTRPQSSVATILWAAGSLVLMLLLFAQYVIFNLNTLIKDPTVAARLQTVCAIAACSLPHADITKLNITDLVHRPSRIKSANAFSDIQATVVNQSPEAQLLPSLKVSIYGKNALIGDFIALPEDYLLSIQKQLAADSHKPVLFTIPVANNQISQVTIDPIY